MWGNMSQVLESLAGEEIVFRASFPWMREIKLRSLRVRRKTAWKNLPIREWDAKNIVRWHGGTYGDDRTALRLMSMREKILLGRWTGQTNRKTGAPNQWDQKLLCRRKPKLWILFVQKIKIVGQEGLRRCVEGHWFFRTLCPKITTGGNASFLWILL